MKIKELLRDIDLLIIGTLPPPIGGISIHLSRLKTHLMKNKLSYKIINRKGSSDDDVYSLSGSSVQFLIFVFKLLCYGLFINNKLLIHIHVSHRSLLLVSWILTIPYSKRIIITVHNEDYYKYKKVFKSIAMRIITSDAYYKVILVSYNMYADFRYLSNSIVHIPAYIKDEHSIPITIKNLNHKKIHLVTSIYNFSDTQQSKYGLDLVLKYLNTRDDVVLHLFVSSTESVNFRDYLERYNFNLEVYLNLDLASRLNNFDLLVRANREDGFGVAILEALDSNLIVLASDTCYRPNGVYTFKSGSFDSLKTQLDKLISNLESIKKEDYQSPDYATKLISIYKEAI